MYFFLKTIISAIIIVAVSEIAKKYTWTAAIIVSLPLTSLLAFIWLYWDTKDYQKVIELSYSTLVMSIPSFVFFIVLLVFGADKIPSIAKGLAKGMTQIRQATNEIKTEISKNTEVKNPSKSITKDLNDSVSDIKKDFDDLKDSIKRDLN